jgi:uncharacterized membrane protein
MKNRSMETFILLLTAVATALIAGLFYGYSCSVNTGLGKLQDLEYLKGFQSINRVILNPWFFLSFFGALILLPLSTWLGYHKQPSPRFYYLLAASIVYIIGTMGVTMLGNVPLNNALDKIDLAAASAREVSLQRLLFERKWNQFHLIRTLASVLSLILVILACITRRNGTL